MDRAIFRPFNSSPAERSDRTAGDRQRHREKVRSAIKENIADIISEESIIGKGGDRIIKVPIRGIKEYRFIYGDNKPNVGQGNGNSQPGQVVGKREGEANGDPDKAGDRPGIDYYETDVTLDELIELMFEDLDFPDLERKRLRRLFSETEHHREGYRKVGIPAHLDMRRTFIKKAKRMVQRGLAGYPKVFDTWEEVQKTIPEPLQKHYVLKDEKYHRTIPWRSEDLTYRHFDLDIKEQSNAVVICIMDTSGSMDTMKKYLARSFFFLLYQFVRTKYKNVDIVFIAHSTEAQEVKEEEFFHKGESGGTFISAGYEKALEIIQGRYSPELWNVYAFHCSDGDNFDSDNNNALKRARELCDICNLFGYAEIKPLGSRYYESSMLNVFRKLEVENFQTVLIEKKEDVYPAFKSLLEKERGEV